MVLKMWMLFEVSKKPSQNRNSMIVSEHISWTKTTNQIHWEMSVMVFKGNSLSANSSMTFFERLEEMLIFLEGMSLFDRDTVPVGFPWSKLQVSWKFSRTCGFTVLYGFFSLGISQATLRDACKQSFCVEEQSCSGKVPARNIYLAWCVERTDSLIGFVFPQDRSGSHKNTVAFVSADVQKLKLKQRYRGLTDCFLSMTFSPV